MTEEDKITYDLLKGCTLIKCVAAFATTAQEAGIIRGAYHACMVGVETTYPHETRKLEMALVGIALAEHHLEHGVPA